MKNTKKIIFSAGGTGGHLFPAVNLMKHFLNEGYEVLLVTDKRGNSYTKKNQELKTYVMKAGTPTNKNIFRKLISFLTIFNSIIRSIYIVGKEKPDLIFGLGGYVSFPISFSSKFFKVPLVIYENNMVLGRANKYLTVFAKKVFVLKKDELNITKKYKHKFYEVGSILDKNIINYSKETKEINKNYFSLLVLGGSQGAKIFGLIIPQVIKMLKNKGYKIKVIQQCIESQKDILKNFYSKNNIQHNIFNFEKNILNLITLSDLAITRCGASSTAELVHAHLPFIAVPLSDSIDNHQYINAKYYENKGCCWLLEQNNFNADNLFNLIVEIIDNKNKLKSTIENMKKIKNKNVYLNIENEIRKLLKNEN
jgi:UDP-N-acetylglucosamine--N-acetylmuramyl-(pentapeptide) pyrophosphoryl-undecaprenol N-acetylglucosamine transferase